MSYSSAYDPEEGVAIVGIAARLPGAHNVEEFWRNLLAGRETISHFSAEELERAPDEDMEVRSAPSYVRARGTINDIDMFDAPFFGIGLKEADVLDPQHRVFLETAWEALEDAGHDPYQFGAPIGVFAGAGGSSYYVQNLLGRRDVTDVVGGLTLMTSTQSDYLTTRVAYKLDLKGPALTIQTACSTSLVAVCSAVQSLLTYQCDMALAGGVEIVLPQRHGYLWQEGLIVSPDGHCRAFDRDAGGTVFGNGVGVVVLRRLRDALADGDRIYAVIKGAATNNDGSAKVSFSAPSVDGQAQVISMAQALAGIDPATISYVEAHGTGTQLGDPAEIAGLSQAFRAGGAADKGYCAIGSVKTNIGHLGAAAGVAGLIKTALALHHRVLPATLHFKSSNPKLEIENSPFYVNTRQYPWPQGDAPRRAGVSSFGVGGTNAHVVLEEAPPTAASERTSRSHHLLVVSARSVSALDRATARLGDHLKRSDTSALEDVAHTLQVGRHAFEHRRAIVCHDRDDAVRLLLGLDAKRVVTASAARQISGVAFLFPGQGAQSVNMGRALYESEASFRKEVDECAEILAPVIGIDLRRILYPSADSLSFAQEKINQTAFTQPALFVLEYALARLWMSWGIEPAAMIGHSLGEYVAATLAGVFARDGALRLIARRARMMQDLPSGAMLAVRSSLDVVRSHLYSEVTVAAINSPDLTVVSGNHAAITEMESRLAARQIDYRRVTTSHAFHSPMMESIAPAFSELVRTTPRSNPTKRWISSLTGAPITDVEAVDPMYWAQQMIKPVRFMEGIGHLMDPSLVLLEVGPGRTLSTFSRQHPASKAEQIAAPSLHPSSDTQSELDSLLLAMGRLWTAGVRVDWTAFHRDANRRRVSLPTYPFERHRHWVTPAANAVRVGPQQTSVAAPQSESGQADAVSATASPTQLSSDRGSHIQQQLGAILSELSGIDANALDPDSAFPELGLDSLLLVQVSRVIQARLGVAVSLREMLEEAQTLRSLAKRVLSVTSIASSEPAAPIAEPTTVTPARAAQAGPLSEAEAVITEGNDSDTFPLSEAQKEIWAACGMGPDASNAFNLGFGLRLTGPISRAALVESIQQIFSRHTALRLRFDPSGEWQRVSPSLPIDVPFSDISALESEQRQKALDAIFTSEATTTFDLIGGAPARVNLVADSSDSLLVLLTAHHIAFDGWSAWIFFQELAQLYNASCRGVPPALPEPESFTKFVRRLDQADKQEASRSAAQYWKKLFEGASAPPLDLPLDQPRPSLKTYSSATAVTAVDENLYAAIKREASKHGSTIVGFLASSFHSLLYRLSGQTDIVIGIPASVRDIADRRTLVGHATNLLPIRVQADVKAPFAAHLRAFTGVLLDAIDNQAISFGELLQQLDLPRDPSRTPLVAATFNLDQTRTAPEFHDAEAVMFSPPRHHMNFELELNAYDTGGKFVFRLFYNPDLFSEAAVQRWLKHYVTLLASATASPETALDRLSLLTDEELASQKQWNSTEVDVGSLCVHERVSAQAALRPLAIAVESRGEAITYRDLEKRVSDLATRLAARGVSPGAIVGVFMERGIDMVVAVLAVMRAGGAYVPLDPAFPADRLSYMLEDSRAVVLLTQRSLEDEVPSRSVPVMLVDDGNREDLAGHVQPVGPSLQDLAYVIYTSGSTGRPKGVAITHRSLVNLLESMQREPGLSNEDVLLSVTTLSFDIAALELYLPLIAGAKVVVASRDEALDGERLVAMLRSGVTVMQATPATWRMLVESGWQGTPGLKVLCGGEALPRELADALQSRAASVWNVYGPTETTIWSSTCRVEPGIGVISIGRPIANTQMWVLDDNLKPKPVGVPGELYIGGVGVARGYWERPELTAERFVADPFSNEHGARLYRTGDMARWLADGRLECLGRIDHQVKIHGFRIELGEIESALAQVRDIQRAVVVVRGAASDPRLVAYVVFDPAAKAPPSTSELRRTLRGTLPDYMVPSLIVEMTAIPMTPNGKVDRRALPDPFADAISGKTEYEAPESTIEKVIASVWQDLLKVDRVSRHDNFFELGGHSLLALRAVSRIERETGRRLDPRAFFFNTLAFVAESGK